MKRLWYWLRAVAAIPAMIEVLEEVSLPPYPDSDPYSLLETLRVRAQLVLDKVNGNG